MQGEDRTDAQPESKQQQGSLPPTEPRPGKPVLTHHWCDAKAVDKASLENRTTWNRKVMRRSKKFGRSPGRGQVDKRHNDTAIISIIFAREGIAKVNYVNISGPVCRMQ